MTPRANKTLNNLKSGFEDWAKVSLLLAALMLGLRIIFSIMVFSRLNIGADKLLIVMSGLKFDGILSGSVATAILLPYVLIHSFSRKAANAIAYTAIALYTLIAFIETEYFITMARPLDHVLLVYPTNEVFDILTSSTSITMPTIINLMLCIGLTCVLIITSKK